MTSHLINKAVMKQNCIKALNQHAQPMEKKAAVSNFAWNFGNPSTKTTYYYYYLNPGTQFPGSEKNYAMYILVARDP